MPWEHLQPMDFRIVSYGFLGCFGVFLGKLLWFGGILGGFLAPPPPPRYFRKFCPPPGKISADAHAWNCCKPFLFYFFLGFRSHDQSDGSLWGARHRPCSQDFGKKISTLLCYSFQNQRRGLTFILSILGVADSNKSFKKCHLRRLKKTPVLLMLGLKP